ncbi:MAG TPA: MaoC/PaaZ C-terminal domain-containing protein [Acidimicrobiales bacterium]|nr:MaoC/PaaZ C-terminal domain-containing protein [Acidimicrobiales bacterium]
MAKPAIHVGTTFEERAGRVDEDAAIAYALATNDPNPIYQRGGAVPPLYTVSLILPAYIEGHGRSADPGAVEGVRGGVHGEHDVYFHAPVVPGMAVRWADTVHSARQTPAGAMLTQRILVTDEDRNPLVEHFWSTLLIGGTIEADLGPPLADHTFPADARDRPIGSRTFEVTGDQTFRYAGASTDHAAFHVDDGAARQAGFPGKFLQGLCTFAMCSGAVVELAAGGDPADLRRLACRFAAPVFPRSELTVELFDAGHTPEGGRAVAFEARSGGATVIRHGRAELAPAGGSG